MAQPSPKMGDFLAALKRTLESLEKLSKKLDRILENQRTTLETEKRPTLRLRKGGVSGLEALDVKALLSIPDHLRKAVMVVGERGEATAEEVSQETGRARAVESSYLNQLVNMGYLKKERKRRTVYFSVAE